MATIRPVYIIVLHTVMMPPELFPKTEPRPMNTETGRGLKCDQSQTPPYQKLPNPTTQLKGIDGVVVENRKLTGTWPHHRSENCISPLPLPPSHENMAVRKTTWKHPTASASTSSVMWEKEIICLPHSSSNTPSLPAPLLCLFWIPACADDVTVAALCTRSDWNKSFSCNGERPFPPSHGPLCGALVHACVCVGVIITHSIYQRWQPQNSQWWRIIPRQSWLRRWTTCPRTGEVAPVGSLSVSVSVCVCDEWWGVWAVRSMVGWLHKSTITDLSAQLPFPLSLVQ